MQFSTLLLSASLLISSVVGAPMASFGGASEAEMMLKRQYEATQWDKIMLGRDTMVELEKRIVYNPHITSPTSNTVWTAGKTVQVTWDASDLPQEAENYTGNIKLGFLPANGEGGYNLKWQLAQGFLIRDEEATITLPADLQSRNDYIIVVMGDSGNKSQKFTIKAKDQQSLKDVIDAKIEAAFEKAGM